MPIDQAKAARWMKKEVKGLRWEPDAFDDVGHSRAKLEAYAARGGTFGGAATGLMVIASFEGAAGCARVLEGHDDGWLQIDRACLYLTWEIHLLACAYDADTRPEKQPRTNLDGAALGASGLRDWLDGRLRKIDGGDGSLGAKSMNPLVALVAHFATGKDPAVLKRSGWADIGPYQRVVSGDFRPEEYDALAEYHTQQVTDHGFPAFYSYPYRLIPFELFAIEKRTGVPIEKAQHPLLTSPLAKRREVREIPVLDELRRVLDRARTEMIL